MTEELSGNVWDPTTKSEEMQTSLSRRHCAKGWVAGGATHDGTSLGNKDPALDFQTQEATGRGVGNRQSTARMTMIKWQKMGMSSSAELCADKVWKTMAWDKGEVPFLKASRSVIGWRTTPAERYLLEAQVRFPLKRCNFGQVKKADGGSQERKRSGSLDDEASENR